MKKTLLSLAILTSFAAQAEEGMWMPQQLPQVAQQLKAAGLELDPASLTKLTEFPMGAVVSLGGCSVAVPVRDRVDRVTFTLDGGAAFTRTSARGPLLWPGAGVPAVATRTSSTSPSTGLAGTRARARRTDPRTPMRRTRSW